MIHFTQPNDHAVGTTIGASIGFAKSIILLDALTWGAVGSTALLAAVGAIVGFIVTSGLKWLRKQITK